MRCFVPKSPLSRISKSSRTEITIYFLGTISQATAEGLWTQRQTESVNGSFEWEGFVSRSVFEEEEQVPLFQEVFKLFAVLAAIVEVLDEAVVARGAEDVCALERNNIASERGP